MSIKLYGHPLSGNCHKVRLLLSALGLPYEEVLVDLLVGAHKQPEFLALNPLGQVPVLVDGDTVISDSQAILVYLARTYDGEKYLPSDPVKLARVVRWLSIAASECHHGPHLARLHFLLKLGNDLALAQGIAHNLLGALNRHLMGRTFLEEERPTIADFAVFPYVGLAHQGQISLAEYPNVAAWVERIKASPSYVAMPGL
jgi:glutathione S-transferase